MVYGSHRLNDVKFLPKIFLPFPSVVKVQMECKWLNSLVNVIFFLSFPHLIYQLPETNFGDAEDLKESDQKESCEEA